MEKTIRYCPCRILYFSSAESLSQPVARGVSPNANILLMIRRRSFFGIASISLAAEGWIRILYLATLLHVLQDLFEHQIGFTGS